MGVGEEGWAPVKKSEKRKGEDSCARHHKTVSCGERQLREGMIVVSCLQASPPKMKQLSVHNNVTRQGLSGFLVFVFSTCVEEHT